MNFAPFDASFFDQTVTFQLQNLDVGQRGGTTESTPFAQVFAPGTAQGGAYVEPDTHRSRRYEPHDQPISRKRWRVITANNPATWLQNIGLDDVVLWGAMKFRILKAPYDGSQGSGVLWVTECEEFGPA